ncbi:hypothetical protein O9X98_15950 [Agrobacterium salinitolerans]|nr:hypothetical protein [Agrobacterium salinitolerans]
MRVTAVRFEKLVVGDEPKRFILTFGVEYTPENEALPYFGRFAIPVPYDESLSMADIEASALVRLHQLFGHFGQVDEATFNAFVEAGKKPFEVEISLPD